jgi:hypothetical protein
MDRRDYLRKALSMGICSGSLFMTDFGKLQAAVVANPDDELTRLKMEKEFVQNWLSDLLDTMEKELDVETRAKLIGGCGQGCFNRHQFKKDIAIKGAGSLDKLMEAYKQNFEIWKDGETVHIRFGEVSPGCYCPAARYREPKPNDMHCECTRATHQAIFETALGRPFKIDILESVRRGNKICHFLVHLH